MVKNLPAMRETWVSGPWLGRSPGEENANPLQYSCLENSMDKGLQSIGSQRVRHDWVTEHEHKSIFTDSPCFQPRLGEVFFLCVSSKFQFSLYHYIFSSYASIPIPNMLSTTWNVCKFLANRCSLCHVLSPKGDIYFFTSLNLDRPGPNL